MNPIYLDYNATTPLDPAVITGMLPYIEQHFGNPSSSHVYGKTTHDAVEHARQQLADLLGAQRDEIVFTGGGTEASNYALKGAVFAKLQGFFGRWAKAAHLIISAVEHPATVQPCKFLERLGCKITTLPVDGRGQVDPDAVKKALDRRTTLVSIMHSNNEVGTLQPIREIAAITKQHGILLHTDAAQSVGKVPVNVHELGVDLLTVAGHKLYAPKGVGALYVRRGVNLEPFIHGAGHEAGRRAGTENVASLVALGQAAAVAREALPTASGRLLQLRERLWTQLRTALGERVVQNGHPEQRLPNTLNISFLGHIGSEVLQRTPEIAASTGSACHEGHVTLSPVLCAMKAEREVNQGAVRLSVGRFTTEEEIDRAAAALVKATAQR